MNFNLSIVECSIVYKVSPSMSYMMGASGPAPLDDFMLPKSAVLDRQGVIPAVGSRVRISQKRGGRNGMIVKEYMKEGTKRFDVKLDHDFKTKHTKDLSENEFEIIGILRRVVHTWEHKPQTTGEYLRSTSLFGALAYTVSPITNIWRAGSTVVQTISGQFRTSLPAPHAATVTCKVHGNGQYAHDFD